MYENTKFTQILYITFSKFSVRPHIPLPFHDAVKYVMTSWTSNKITEECTAVGIHSAICTETFHTVRYFSLHGQTEGAAKAY